MLQAPTVPPPIVVRVFEEPTKELGVADVLIQALGMTGALVVGAALFGVLLGAIFIGLRVFRPGNQFNGASAEDSRLNLEPPVRPAGETR